MAKDPLFDCVRALSELILYIDIASPIGYQIHDGVFALITKLENTSF